MTRNDIKISVAGLPASGKSRVLFMIKHILKEEGFNVKHNGNTDYKDEAEFDKRMLNNIDKVVEHFKETKTITIEEVQYKREAI